MDIIEELRQLLLKVGIEEEAAKSHNMLWPLAGQIMDSIEYTEFVVAVEERYGIKVVDPPDAPFVRSLNDFKTLIEGKP